MRPGARASGTGRARRGATPKIRPYQEILLEPWQEVTGLIEHIRATEAGKAVIRLRDHGMLEVSGLSEEAIRELLSIPRGTRVSILRTSLPHRPYAVRTRTGVEGPTGPDAKEV